MNREEDDITDSPGEFTTEFDVVGDNAALANDAKGDCLVDVVKYGVYHTPKQFWPVPIMFNTRWIQPTIWKVLPRALWILFFNTSLGKGP